jgi:magnesium-transporting ATPase (P-type)
VFCTVVVSQGTVVVAGRARAVVIGVGSNTAMGSIRDAMLRTEDVSMKHIFLLICAFSGELSYVISLHSKCIFLLMLELVLLFALRFTTASPPMLYVMIILLTV